MKKSIFKMYSLLFAMALAVLLLSACSSMANGEESVNPEQENEVEEVEGIEEVKPNSGYSTSMVILKWLSYLK